MLTDGTNYLRSSISHSGKSSSPTLPLSMASGEPGPVPLPPAMPGSVVLLQLLVSSSVVDLHVVTEVIRNDVGLVVAVLRTAGLEYGRRSSTSLSIADLVVRMGLEKLKCLAMETALIRLQRRPGQVAGCERFWAHARLTAGIAEGLAGQTVPANREDAYIAGLLHRVGALPALLGWEIPGLETRDEAAAGYRLAKAWQLPDFLADVILGDPRDCNSRLAYSLLNVVESAEERAGQLESIGKDEDVATQAWC